MVPILPKTDSHHIWCAEGEKEKEREAGGKGRREVGEEKEESGFEGGGAWRELLASWYQPRIHLTWSSPKKRESRASF